MAGWIHRCRIVAMEGDGKVLCDFFDQAGAGASTPALYKGQLYLFENR